ncbi:MAG: fatty acid desaturase [Gammaproteobacteria bacterium]|nr:fatty acid desaturase [Gammaproteobacteria bacterium]
MTSLDSIKKETPNIVAKYGKSSNLRGFMQVLNTLLPFFALFYLAMESVAAADYVMAAVYILLATMFNVRIFMLMHDSGHKSLFHTQSLNRLFGFITGALVGLSGYVWSKHHDYHHATNGDWERYRGPLNVFTLEDYEQLSAAQQRKYRFTRHLLFVPIGAFFYFIFNPRFNWAVGSIVYLIQLLMSKLKNLSTSMKELIQNQGSKFWKPTEYWPMFWNNVVLLSVWYIMSLYFGAGVFFTVYLAVIILAGATAIIIFTIQHNFEDSLATETKDWDYYEGAISGTSYLTLPRWMNWFSADIAYHHIHHISPIIPNYNLEACHKEYAHLFSDVKRLRFWDIPATMEHVLWDRKNKRIVKAEPKLQ